MKTSKLFVLASSILLLASCGAGGNSSNQTNGAALSPEESKAGNSAASPEASSLPVGENSSVTPIDSSKEPIELPELNVYLYKKFVSEANSNEIKSAFEAYLTQVGYKIVSLNWVLETTGNVAALNSAIEEYNVNHAEAKIDVILGGKAIGDYVTENYEYLVDGEGNDIYMSTTDEGGTTKDDRRVWIAKDSDNLDAMKLLVKHLVNVDLSDGEEGPIETSSSEEAVSSIVENSSKEEGSSVEDNSSISAVDPIVLPELNVYLYKKFVSEANSSSLKSGFETYLSQNGYAVTTLNWVLETTGNVSALNSAISDYNSANAEGKIDVILGAKAIGDYVTENYDFLVDGEGNEIYMSTTDEGGTTKDDRRIWVAKNSDNFDAMKLLVKHLVDFDLVEKEEEEEHQEQGSSEEVISEVQSSEESVSEESSSSEVVSNDPVTLPLLSVYCYEKYCSASCSDALEFGFEQYLADHSITITSLNWTVGTTGNTTALDTAISTYDSEHEDAKIDVILGAKATGNYVGDAFSYLKDDSNNQISMTTTDASGSESNDRRIWVRTGSANADAIDALVAYLTADGSEGVD